MLDLETYSTLPTATIIQIGACRFDFDNGITDEFLCNVDPKSCLELGCHISKDTLAWWQDKPQEIKDSLKVDRQPLPVMIERFTEWAKQYKDAYVWCNGGSFDFPIISHAYHVCNIERPWPYWKEVDLRTVSTLFDTKLSASNTHNAMEDTKNQIEKLLALFKGVS